MFKFLFKAYLNVRKYCLKLLCSCICTQDEKIDEVNNPDLLPQNIDSISAFSHPSTTISNV